MKFYNVSDNEVIDWVMMVSKFFVKIKMCEAGSMVRNNRYIIQGYANKVIGLDQVWCENSDIESL